MTFTNHQKEILSVRETMNLLGLSRSSIYRRMKNGILTAYRMSGKIYFKRSEILAAIEAGKETVKAAA